MSTWTVERSTDRDGPWTEVATGLTEKEAALVGEPVGEWFWYRVRERAGGQDVGRPSRPIRVAILDTPVLSAVIATAATNFIRVEWGATCANKYRVYRWIPSTGEWEPRGVVSDTEFVDYGVGNGVTYRYAVAALTDDEIGETPLSNVGSGMLTPGGVFSVARSTQFQGIQVGLEVTPGTAVAATRRLHNMEIMFSDSRPNKEVKYAGSLVATDTQRGKRHAPFRFNGVLDFNTINYIFQSMFGTKAATTTGTLVKTRVWQPSPVLPVTPKTYTIEQGAVAGAAEKVAYGLFSGFTTRFGEEDAAIEGTGFGAEYIRNITPTDDGGDLLPSLQPAAVDPSALGLWWSEDGVSWNRLTKVLDGEMRLNGMFEPVFHVREDVQTFDDVRQVAPDFGATLTFEDGDEIDTFYDYLEAIGEENKKVWLGLKTQGELIETVTMVDYYELIKLEIPAYVMAPDPGDKNGVFGNTFTFNVGRDEGWGMIKATCVSKLATLA